MAQADAALEICIIGGHVVGADQVVNASPWAANRSHDIVARAQLSHVRTNRFDLTKTFEIGRASCRERVKILVSVGISKRSMKTHNANPCGRIPHLTTNLNLKRYL